MTDFPRLIEHAFPLKEASLDSVHEKNVRHGHISTLHIWPARRPLAACRAALIATLLPDPGDAEKRKELCEKIAGKVVKKIERKKMPNGQTVERVKEETVGGILHWGRETENAETLEWFRQEIKKAYGGRAPKVLDPFAGGGAIPLEAMRLGCEATAVDINPVAWFILKCTLEYPQKLAGQTRPLPEFILHNDAFMAEFFQKAKGYSKSETKAAVKRLHELLKKRIKWNQKQDQKSFAFEQEEDPDGNELQADLAWHVRAWGQWVLDRARRELAQYYPTYADFEPLVKGKVAYEHQPMRLVPLKEDGTADIESLNAEFTQDYLDDKWNPRWVAKPTVAYLWARTVTCKNCRAAIPLLKTRWLCKKANKRVLLTMRVEQASVPTANESDQVEQASVPAFSRRNLPRWRMPGAIYFVTWRVHKNQPDLTPEERDLVLAALNHFDGQRYTLYAWVVMNDHVHVVVRPHEGFELEQLTHSWKSFTANQLQRRFGRRGAVWQDESWDRILRDEEEFWEKVEYILGNPRKRWPELNAYRWVGWRHLKDTGTEAGATSTEAGATSTEAKAARTLVEQASVPVEQISVPVPRVVFGIERNVPLKGGNAAQRREHDKRIGAGTMSRSGAKCPCCGLPSMTMQDIRLEGKAERLGSLMTAVVVETPGGKDYRRPTAEELRVATPSEERVQAAFRDVPFGVPDEPTPAGGGTGAGRAFSVQGYGLMKWRDLFTTRQLLALGTFVAATRAARDAMAQADSPAEWIEAVYAALTIGVDRIVDRQSTVCRWDMGYTKLQGTFTRFALPITWDFCEGNPFSDTTGNYAANLEWVAKYWEHAMIAGAHAPMPHVKVQSAIERHGGGLDAIVTDPPYYDAIPYSDLMDFFYIWLRRTLSGISPATEAAFSNSLAPKWNHDTNDGELIDDASRHGTDAAKSKQIYEDGMARVFESCWHALDAEGRLVIVFAHKHPDAWETLVSAIIRAGFVVGGSWPIQTEMGNRTRALSGAALASSVWLICKKRPATARPGWDNNVLEEMKANIAVKLREFWDAGIRGPDFVWAATGPAMEAYSKHPVVRKANEPNETMGVGEFLNHVRRMVVDYIVGQVLTGERGADLASADRLDEVTAYYLLHRHDFGLDEAPVGACILYATACGLSDAELERTWNILTHAGGRAVATDEDDDGDEDSDGDAEPEEDSGGGSKVKLKPWNQRQHKSMGYEAPEGKAVPLIDRIHRVMHLWKEGDVLKVDEYLDEHALRRNELFKRVVQSLIELSTNSERSLLESISNHIGAKGAVKDRGPRLFDSAAEDE